MRLIERIKEHGIPGSMLVLFRKTRSVLRAVIQFILICKARLCCRSYYIVREIQGSKMLLNLNDRGISRELFFTGVHESESTRQIKHELRPGMNVLEIGANVGYYALLEAKLIGTNGRIIAFEPSMENVINLKLNTAINNLDERIEIYQVGAGSSNGKAEFYCMNKGNTSSFYKRENESSIATTAVMSVDVVTVDHFFENRDEHIDFFRMDVEGYEFEIIKGMEDFLDASDSPQKCFIEVHSRLLNENGYSAGEFINFLKSFGYEIKTARYRGRADTVVNSNSQLLEHPLCEQGYWEAFFEKQSD